MTPKSPQEIIGEAVRDITKVEVRTKATANRIIRQAMKDLLGHAIERLPRKYTEDEGIDAEMDSHNRTIDDCIAVLKELRDSV